MSEHVIVNHLGEVRHLGMTQPTDDHLMMRAARKSFRDALEATGNKLIPRKDWKTIDRSSMFDTSWILNQLSTYGCTGGSCASALMKTLFLRYGKKLILSGSFIYAGINYNRDAGSNIIEAAEYLVRVGTCLRDEFDYPKIFTSQIPKSAFETAKRFRLADWYQINTFDELGTAIQMGFMPHFDTRVWGRRGERYDDDGCCAYQPGQTNHAITADGMDNLPSGEPIILGVNDWGLWGLNKDGRMRLHEPSFGNGGNSQSAYVMVAADPDPQSPGPPAPA